MQYNLGLAALTFDPEGALLLPWHPDHNLGGLQRRVRRTKTLDGGVAVVNRGYAAADRTLNISLENLPDTTRQQISRLFKLHNNITISTEEGSFLVVAESLLDNTLVLLVVEEL